jgi:hypothetical protein
VKRRDAGLCLLMSSHLPALKAHVPREVGAAGVCFRWHIQTGPRGTSDELHGCVEAATTGWVAVGFNTRAGLAGTRLVMTRVVGGQAQAEMQIADPPHHRHQRQADGTEWVRAVTGEQLQGRTRVCFVMPLRTDAANDRPLQPGQATHLVLAWSHEADFKHHSAQRESLTVTL